MTYVPSLFEKLIPVIDNYILCQLKLKQLKAKRIEHILPEHRQELEDSKRESTEQIFEIIHLKTTIK